MAADVAEGVLHLALVGGRKDISTLDPKRDVSLHFTCSSQYGDQEDLKTQDDY